MPKVRKYRTGALIFFQGEPADNIYVLQKGNVSLVYQDMGTGVDIRDSVQCGEFFGVKSALGRYRREENAVALSDSTVMAFSVPEFEQFAAANSRLLMKMLQVFSNKLRRVHRQIASLMKAEEVDAEFGLYNVGDYYLKNKRYAHAKYTLGRYLTYYPDGKYAAQASKGLKIAESSVKREVSIDRAASKASDDTSTQDDAETLIEKEPSGALEPDAVDLEISDPDTASDDAPGSDAEPVDAAAAYYNALSFITQEKYQLAYSAFKKIVDSGTENEYTEKSAFDMGRCIFLLGKYDDCIKYYTQMLIKDPEHPELPDILFHIGQSHEKLDRKDQAAAFYKKAIAQAGDTDDSTRIKAKRMLHDLEAS
ncbi:cAMP-binding protein [Spirochaetia bacterium]|nr:cAMP-binding protein [Spirochaetia bacterium]